MMTRLGRLSQKFNRIARATGFALILSSTSLIAIGQSEAAFDMDRASVAHAAPHPFIAEEARMPVMPPLNDRHSLQAAASIFVWGLSNRQADAIWFFAPETERERFGESAIALRFFVQVHPPLANAKSLRFDGVVERNGIPAAQIYITDRLGVQWLATLGFVLNEEGNWKIVNCHMIAAPGQLT